MFGKKDKNPNNSQSSIGEGDVIVKKEDYEILLSSYQLNTLTIKENNDLKERISVLEDSLKKLTEDLSNVKKSDENVLYTTDEDELEMETNPDNSRRQSIKRRRKGKSNSKHESISQNDNSTSMDKSAQKTPKIPLPPPINVSNVNNYKSLSEKIVAAACSAKFKAITANDIKITVGNEDDYRKTKKLLEEETASEGENSGIVYHTYQLKSEKSYRAVIRGLPPSCDEQEITEELQKQGHEIIKTINIIKKIKKEDGKKSVQKFPLFLVEMKQKENNKEIFNIKYLLHCKIKVEAPHKVKAIPQCLNCQQLGHTKNFCTREAVCVKCAGKHQTINCTKKYNTAPKCALCQQEGHTANYKGCSVYQKRLKSQNQPAKSAVNRLRASSSGNNTQQKTISTLNPSTSGLTFAQVTKNLNNTTTTKQIPQKNEPSISDILKLLIEMKTDIGLLSNRLEKLEDIQNKPKNNKVKSNKND